VAALAYVLPPLSGLVAYLSSDSERIRWHGLQSVLLGVTWPVALFGAALLTPGVTQVVWVVGALAWLTLLVGAAVGRNPRLPGVGARLRAWAQDTPR
jgi:uncharacterized membrane protein